MTVLLHCWSYLISYCLQSFGSYVVHVHLFPGQSPLNLFTFAIILSFIPLEDAWIFAFSASLVHCCQRLSFGISKSSEMEEQARDQSCDLREQCEASTRGMNKLISTFPISINSFMVSLTICWADELGPLSQEDGRLTYIIVWTLTRNWVDWSKLLRKEILLLQSLILMTRTLCD